MFQDQESTVCKQSNLSETRAVLLDATCWWRNSAPAEIYMRYTNSVDHGIDIVNIHIK